MLMHLIMCCNLPTQDTEILVGFCGRNPRTNVSAALRAWLATSSGLLFFLFITGIGLPLIDAVVVELELELERGLVERGDDGTADMVWIRVCSLSADPSNRQSIPYCFLS